MQITTISRIRTKKINPAIDSAVIFSVGPTLLFVGSCITELTRKSADDKTWHSRDKASPTGLTQEALLG